MAPARHNGHVFFSMYYSFFHPHAQITLWG